MCDYNKAWSDKCPECNGIGEIEVTLTNGDLFRMDQIKEMHYCYLS